MAVIQRIGIRISTNKASKILRIRTLNQGHVFHDTLLLHAAFTVLVDFVNSTGEDEIVKTNPRSAEILKLYQYWTTHRPNLVHREDSAREWNDRGDAAKFEAKRKRRDNSMLSRLIAIRGYLSSYETWKLQTAS